MKTDINGCSTCKPGEEKYETFYSRILKKNIVQYEYRMESGKLFGCIAPTLEKCREKKDEWLEIQTAEAWNMR